MPNFGDALDRAIPKLTEKLGEITHGLTEHLVPASTVLERTEEGRFAKQALLQNKYYPVLNQEKERLGLQAKQFIVSEKAQGRTPGDADIGKIISKAQKKARLVAGGPKDAKFVALAQSVYQKKGQLAAESFSNALAYSLKDYSVDTKGTSYSPLKAAIRKSGVPIRDSNPSYIPAGKTERAVASTLNSAFAPAIAIVHTSTILNGALGTDPGTFVKGAAKSLTYTLDQDIEHQEALLITGAHAEHHLEDLREWNLFHSTGAPNWRTVGDIRGRSAAEILYKGLHQPGFSPLRDYTRLQGVNIAQMTLSDLAERYAKNPSDKSMMFSLTKWGLDPKTVVKQGGVLSREQLENGIYQWMDGHYYMDNIMYRSPLFGGTPVGRILGMYHSYITRQARLMARSMTDVFRGQGIMAYARNMAIITTMFPVVGEIIKLSQMGARGQDVKGQAEQDYEGITGQGPEGVWGAPETYIEAQSHMATFGIYNHLLRGGYFHSITDELGGPVLSAADRLQHDVRYMSTHKGEEGSADPLTRDVTYDIPGVSTLAYVLNHRLLPKANEDVDQDPARQLYNWFQDTGEEPKTSTTQPKKEEKKHGRSVRNYVVR